MRLQRALSSVALLVLAHCGSSSSGGIPEADAGSSLGTSRASRQLASNLSVSEPSSSRGPTTSTESAPGSSSGASPSSSSAPRSSSQRSSARDAGRDAAEDAPRPHTDAGHDGGAHQDSGGDATTHHDATLPPDGAADARADVPDGAVNPPIVKSSAARVPAASVPMSAQIDAIQANNAFSVALYEQLRGGAASTNLVVSPLSANIALTMTYAGAQGSTASQMATALQLGGNASSVFAGQDALLQALGGRGAAAYVHDLAITRDEGYTAPDPSDYQLEVVSSVWGQLGYTWRSPFLDILAEDYGTGVYVQDFEHQPDAALGLINAWGSQETDGNIPAVLPPGSIGTYTRLVLANAVHLELPWDTAFGTASPASFTTMNGTSSHAVSTPFLNRTDDLNYDDDGTAQIVWLPLVNDQLYVVVALPHDDLSTYEAGLTASSRVFGPPGSESLVELAVPKVSFSSKELDLVAPLKALGMIDGFSSMHGVADFSGMTVADGGGNPDFYVGNVVQTAEIGMAEDGVQASAVTVVVLSSDGSSATSTTPPTPIPMIVDRPYFFSIIDAPTGAVLFMGHVVDPTQG